MHIFISTYGCPRKIFGFILRLVSMVLAIAHLGFVQYKWVHNQVAQNEVIFDDDVIDSLSSSSYTIYPAYKNYNQSLENHRRWQTINSLSPSSSCILCRDKSSHNLTVAHSCGHRTLVGSGSQTHGIRALTCTYTW